MTHARKMLAGIAVALVVGAGAMAADTTDSPSNPYQGIVDRNVFALKPPPPPPDPETLKPPTPDFELTGIITIGGKRALFKAIPKHGKTADPAAKDRSFMLSEGQREGEVEVNRIDEIAKVVTVTCGGTVITLDFTNNAAKAVAVAAPAPPPRPPVPGVGPRAGVGIQPPPPAHAGLRQPGGPGNDRRPIRGGGAAGMGAAQQTTAAAQQDTGLTREQQEIVMEAMREQGQSDPATPMPPLPPTSLSPLIEAANEEARAPAANSGPPVPAFTAPVPPGPARPF
ncbi:MAG: hypothetical protein ACLQVX_13650 [Limisphaerales bacterium]